MEELNNDDITLVYKTFGNDLQWLQYSLMSIIKFVTNYNKIIIYCHDKACYELYKLIERINIKCQVIPVTYDFHGYIKQMVVKCECYKDVTTKYIVILDSDNIFKKSFNMRDLINKEGKIEWLYSTKESDPTNKVWTIWKKSYEDMTNTKQNVHFMSNGFPFVFTRDSMEKADKYFRFIHNMSYSDFCKQRLNNNNINITDKITDKFITLATIFEEFEWLGFYCSKNNLQDYIFLQEKTNNSREVSSKIIQYWSHGGITSDIKKEILSLLGYIDNVPLNEPNSNAMPILLVSMPPKRKKIKMILH
jgi:hypothetical protein